MSKSIVGIARTTAQTEIVIDELQKRALVPPADISVLIPDSGGTPELGAVRASKAPEGATAGVVTGGIAGGAVGLLAGVGALAIPGLGPFIAAGPLMAALSGAAAGALGGGIVGALVGMGIPEYEAKAFEKEIREGGYLVAVHVEDHQHRRDARKVMEDNGLKNISSVSEA